MYKKVYQIIQKKIYLIQKKMKMMKMKIHLVSKIMKKTYNE